MPPEGALEIVVKQSILFFFFLMCFLDGSDGKESACNAGDPRFDPWVGKMPWRREWQPTPVFLPGEFSLEF